MHQFQSKQDDFSANTSSTTLAWLAWSFVTMIMSFLTYGRLSNEMQQDLRTSQDSTTNAFALNQSSFILFHSLSLLASTPVLLNSLQSNRYALALPWLALSSLLQPQGVAAQVTSNIIDLRSTTLPAVSFINAGGKDVKVSYAPDINGDNLPEILIGTHLASPQGRTEAGSTYLIWGNKSLPKTVDLANWNTSSLGIRFDGAAAYDNSGTAIASIPDINGDNLTEILIGAHRTDYQGRSSAGSAYLIWGNKSWSGIIDLATWNTSSLGIRFDGATEKDLTGWALASMPDINGDNIPEILIAAPGAEPEGRIDAGSTYLIWGNKSLPVITDLAIWDTSNLGIRFDGATSDNSGTALASIRDINGDNVSELLIGAAEAFPTSRTYLIWGSKSLPKTINLAAWDAVNLGIRFNGAEPLDRTGVAIASIPDINGDKLPEILIGAKLATPQDRTEAGKSYLIWGSKSLAKTINLANLNTANLGIRFEGDTARDWSGIDLASIPDINGDSLPEILIGAYKANPRGRTDAGSSYLIWGKKSLSPIIDLSLWNTSNLGIRFDGALAGDNSGIALASIPDINGDHQSEILIGTAVGKAHLVLSSALGFTSAPTPRPTPGPTLDPTTVPITEATNESLTSETTTTTSGATAAPTFETTSTLATTILTTTSTASTASSTSTQTHSSLFLPTSTLASTSNTLDLSSPVNNTTTNFGLSSTALYGIICGVGSGLLLTCATAAIIFAIRRKNYRDAQHNTQTNHDIELETNTSEKTEKNPTQQNAMTTPTNSNPTPVDVDSSSSSRTSSSTSADYSSSNKMPDANDLIDLTISSDDIAIGKELGRGGFGMVYKGTGQGKIVAIKQLNVSDFSPKIKGDFLKEALTMSELRSPNVVQLFGLCIDKKPYSLLMEFMAGGSLYELLQSEKDLPWERRMHIMLEVGRGLSYLHDKNIIHRDLKSPNVLLTKEQDAKLSDFGLSTVKSTSTQTTYHNGIVGSVCWMAPELFKKGAQHTEKSDVYSYGMVMWEIAARDVPYKNTRGKMELRIKLIEQDETEKRPDETPDEIWEVIEGCWNKNPEQRPTAKTLVKTLSAASTQITTAMQHRGLFSIKDNLTSVTIDDDEDKLSANKKDSLSAKENEKKSSEHHNKHKDKQENASASAANDVFSIKPNLTSM